MGSRIPLNDNRFHPGLNNGDGNLPTVHRHILYPHEDVSIILILFTDPLKIMLEEDSVENITRRGENHLFELFLRKNGIPPEANVFHNGIFPDNKNHAHPVGTRLQIHIYQSEKAQTVYGFHIFAELLPVKRIPPPGLNNTQDMVGDHMLVPLHLNSRHQGTSPESSGSQHHHHQQEQHAAPYVSTRPPHPTTNSFQFLPAPSNHPRQEAFRSPEATP